MAATHNIRGTSYESFRISKGGPTFYQGENLPSDAAGIDGDIYIRTGPSALLYQKVDSSWVSLNLQYQSKIIQTVSANYTTASDDDVIFVDTTTAPITITLSNAITLSGRSIIVKDWSGSSETNSITIQGESTQTIDGSTAHIINRNYESLTLTSDGIHWFII